ncbi:MAG: hypothetical protein IIZ27_04700 [Solobacterium sp.]|nr:hypothetical protein [Solobacterium sp.]
MDEVLNQELMISVPEGFHVMSEEELSKLNHYGQIPNWCVSDPDRHIILSVSWKKSGFASLLLNTAEVAKKMEGEIHRLLASYGYTLKEFISEDIGGISADGFRYSYTAQNVPMIGESLSVKKGKVFYYIHGYLREELQEESLRTLEEIFRTCHWQ